MVSSGTVQLRIATPDDAPAVLAFITDMGFSPRTSATWHGLNMSAMTAWQDGRLVGAIPFEPRQLLWGGAVAKSLHQTCVAVNPAQRGSGLGTSLQAALATHAQAQSQDLITVFRENPATPAYRWYVKNDFAVATTVDSFFADDPASISGARFFVHEPATLFNLDGQFAASYRKAVGVVCRTHRPTLPWLAVHPYATRYRFAVVTPRFDLSAGYALLGIGKLHSDTERADVLQLVGEPEQLIRSVCAASAHHQWRPVRIPFAAAEPAATVARAMKLRSGWSFDVLVKPVRAEMKISADGWRYSGLDFA